jgi:hypothetical protein
MYGTAIHNVQTREGSTLVSRTYERLLLFNVLIVVVEAPVDLVVLLPLRNILDLLRPVIDSPENRDNFVNQKIKSVFVWIKT